MPASIESISDILSLILMSLMAHSAKLNIDDSVVEFGLALKWTPEQISGASHRISLPVSHK